MNSFIYFQKTFIQIDNNSYKIKKGQIWYYCCYFCSFSSSSSGIIAFPSVV